MKKYYITFGMKYGKLGDGRDADTHPTGFAVDSYSVVEIHANSYDEARRIASAVFTNQWAFIYDEVDFEGQAAKYDLSIVGTLKFEPNTYRVIIDLPVLPADERVVFVR